MADKSEPILQIDALTKHFGKTEVLKGIDLSIAPQQLVFIIGPSGSGKSTLLRCCNRLERPDGGRVIVDGVDLMDSRTDINACDSALVWYFSHSICIRT